MRTDLIYTFLQVFGGMYLPAGRKFQEDGLHICLISFPSHILMTSLLGESETSVSGAFLIYLLI